jgi:hypothetical protein
LYLFYLANLSPSLDKVYQKFQPNDIFEAAFIGNRIHKYESFSPSNVAFKVVGMYFIFLRKHLSNKKKLSEGFDYQLSS